MPSNEPNTTELPRYEDGDTTEELPVIQSGEPVVRLPDRSGITVVVGSELYRDATSTDYVPPRVAHTAELPAVRTHLTFRRLIQPVTSSRLIHALLASNVLVLCVAIGLFAGGLWVASEVGVIPAVPGVTQSDPKPAKTPEHKKEHRTPPATTDPGNWSPVAGPVASKPATSSASPKASTSASASPSASASATAQPEASTSATSPASPETTAPATTPSASAPTSAESSPAAEPTSSAPEAPVSPTGETPSSNPETADPTVTP